MRNQILIFFLLLSSLAYAQQNQFLFHTHYLGESNFLNPAVQSECKWFVGIPVLSSVHVNYANSGFTFNQLVKNTSDSTYLLDVDNVINRLGRRTLIGVELHTSLFALGFKRDNYYYSFSIIEKNNIPFTLPKDMFVLAWNGNSSFEGETASLRGTASYATYYREYSFGISKNRGKGNYIGIKGKLLFGKLNMAIPRSNVNLDTDEDNFDLRLSGDAKGNFSGPVTFDTDNGQFEVHYDESIEIKKLFFNRKNMGLAFDAGFIKQIDDRTTLSGSVLDLGFIRWRSYLTNISAEDDITYSGALVDTGFAIESILDSVEFIQTNNPYFTFLPIKTYLGVNYKLTKNLDARALGSAVIYKSKFTPAFTLSLDYNPFGFFHLLGSYSMFYGAYNSFGAGISVGRGPIQFYALSDNVVGIIKPMNARNINLRFGFNMNFGCKEKKKLPDEYKGLYGTCHTYDDTKPPGKIQKRRRR